jgi:hypothetical protein
MRHTVALLLALLCPRVAGAEPQAQPHEFYWHAGADYLAGARELTAGLGSGPGYRLHLSENLEMAGEMRYLVLAGNRVTLAAGGAYAFRSGFWRPSIGIFGQVFLGQRILVIDSDHPDPVSVPAVSVSLRLSPLQFRSGRYTATVLAVSPALGVTSRHIPVGFSIVLLALGARF